MFPACVRVRAMSLDRELATKPVFFLRLSNVDFSCELTWRGPCACTGRDKADRQLQISVSWPRFVQVETPNHRTNQAQVG
jgi:hypothetical protein